MKEIPTRVTQMLTRLKFSINECFCLHIFYSALYVYTRLMSGSPSFEIFRFSVSLHHFLELIICQSIGVSFCMFLENFFKFRWNKPENSSIKERTLWIKKLFDIIYLYVWNFKAWRLITDMANLSNLNDSCVSIPNSTYLIYFILIFLKKCFNIDIESKIKIIFSLDCFFFL